ncbi:MAG: hypothetical protein AAFY52_12260, partial [Pseudomonadota bacterium]
MRLFALKGRSAPIALHRPDVVAVCYDDWSGDESYRRAALDRLDLPGRDLDLGAVQRYGGGS